MKKLFWVDLRNFEKNLFTAAVEAGADAILLSKGKSKEAKELAKIMTIAEDGDLVLGKDVELVNISQKSDEDTVVSFHGKIPVILENADWTIIPLENLISKTTNLIQSVSSPQEAKLALKVMERGADGVLLKPVSVNDILETGRTIRDAESETLVLEIVTITEMKPVTMSDRCCIDTTSLLPSGTGFLVGDSGKAMFLVHNENVEGLYCATRPFRVNSGAVHAYIRLPHNRTKYLCELNSGDEVLAVSPDGKGQVVAVGRNKIERRPMLLVIAENKEGKKVSLVLQNAETIRLTTPEGKPASVTRLIKGDKVLAFFGSGAGRHFGEEIHETIQEK
ncbi:3-dehydroquinate synthase II [Candidatus Peregrinibacteria bacterium]|nr:MAG: 3-dehydroquinate synthase II [Candidatus Peregrinibacteria bacterium]